MPGGHKTRLAHIAAVSTNEKIGAAATTLVSQVSCPTDCVFKDGGGCYAEGGNLAGITKRMNRAAGDAIDAAREEARLIDETAIPMNGWPMRLHTVGDCASGAAALIVSRAAERWMARGGGPVWTYTHAWRTVSRAVWGRVSVLASCETADDIREARARGYAPSVVVAEFRSHHAFDLDGEKVIPCPAQTREGVSCSSCRLCMDDLRINDHGSAIGFAVHGSHFDQHKARLALERPDDPERRLTSRQLIPRLLAEDPTLGPRRIAERLGLNESSTGQMMRRLREEGVIA